ncbi:porin [Burkholderia sp. IMCC1007]|uniref:porin n=1 Tax=Burkholderia sp. IMCC1007 TaxID=3004104 RepID=UPI0022B37281|nr:porin [Burkholderia sp. IMCC1007]
MNKHCLILVAALCASGHAAAQSSVTLYGLISEGLTWANNEGGAHSYRLLSGSNQNNRIGFKINEDLGGGTQAIAQLENGFDINNGRFGQGGRMFGRQAFVGLSDARFGTLTAGRQYDMFWDYLTPFAAGVANTGLLAAPGDADNLMGSWRYNNAIKYRSPNLGGFDVEAMYAFSNAAGQFSVNRAFSAGARLVHGPFQIAAAYVEIDQPGTVNANGAVTDDYAGAPFFLFRTSPLNATAGVKRQRNYGIGGRYDVGYGVRLNAVIDAIRYTYSDGTSLSLNNYDVSVSYMAMPDLTFAAGYSYTSGRYGGLDANPHWNGAQLSIDYNLSKRTDVYIFDTFQRKSGPHAVADVYLYAPSTTSTQNVVVAGIRHRF